MVAQTCPPPHESCQPQRHFHRQHDETIIVDGATVASGGEPGRVDRVKDSIPMGRGGEPEEVARAILWLAGSEASFITGTFLDVTGGK